MRRVSRLTRVQQYTDRRLDGFRRIFQDFGGAYHSASRLRWELECEVGYRVIQCQALWSNVARCIITSSALGTMDGSGASHRSQLRSFRSEHDVLLWTLTHVGRGRPTYDAVGRLSTVGEPLWHHPARVLTVAMKLRLTNLSAIQRAVSGASTFLEDFNKIRNYYAHRGEYLSLAAREVSLRYGNPVPPRPIDVIFQDHPTLHVPLWAAWLNEIELVVDNMVH